MDRQFAKQLTKQRTSVLSINERLYLWHSAEAWHLAGNQEEDLLKTNVNKGNTKARLFFGNINMEPRILLIFFVKV